MLSPLTIVLTKVFVRGFYREHAGLLLFLFVTLISYCFYIQVLNQTHLPPEDVILYNLILVLTLITSPFVVVLMFVIWLVLTIKSWKYVTGQLFLPANQFLFYSSTAMSRIAQFKSWFVVQVIISLPMSVYGLFSLAVGIAFGHYIIPIVVLAYVVLLALISAAVYVRYANVPVSMNNRTVLSRIVRRWSKPFFSLFLYYVVDKLKIMLVITKVLSCALMAGGMYLLGDLKSDIRVPGMITLGLIITHSILIFQFYHFEFTRLSFSRNFPYSKSKLYLSWAAMYLLLTVPENIWFLATFDTVTAIQLLLFNIGTAMLFRSLLYSLTADMKRFLYRVFYLFTVFFIMILLKLLWVLVLVNLFLSVIIFYRGYYRQRLFLNT